MSPGTLLEAENARLASELASSRKEASSWQAQAKDVQASLLQARLESQQSVKEIEEHRIWLHQSEAARRELEEEVCPRRHVQEQRLLSACTQHTYFHWFSAPT